MPIHTEVKSSSLEIWPFVLTRRPSLQTDLFTTITDYAHDRGHPLPYHTLRPRFLS